jgi:hypothetical protein
MKTVRFTLDEASAAWGGKFNCGPAAICALLDLTPDELRPRMGEFESKGYTNPTLMFETLERCNARHRRIYRSDEPNAVFPKLQHGVVRVQWGGPWTKPGVPMRVRYRQTHWVGARENSTEIFDVNAMCIGGWMPFTEWAGKLVPWLIRECCAKADGTWWPTHALEVENAKEPTTEEMRVVCAWCGKVLREPPDATKTSHSVCRPLCPPAAAAVERKNLMGLAL